MRHHRRQKVRPFTLLLATCLSTLLALPVEAEDPPSFEPLPEGLEAAAYLEFGEELDNRCMLLSQGGKVVWMRNRHPTMAVRFRLIRVYSGAPQGGRVVGVLPPGPEGTQLGCNLVTGREQHWDVERVSLEAWTPPPPEDTDPAVTPAPATP